MVNRAQALLRRFGSRGGGRYPWSHSYPRGTSSRNRLNLGLQVFALRRTVRSSFPHRATARWGPRIVSASNPLSRSPLYPRGVMSSFMPRWLGVCRAVFENIVSVSVRAGHPAGPCSNSRKIIVKRRTGRRPRRPADFPAYHVHRTRTGRTLAGPCIVFRNI